MAKIEWACFSCSAKNSTEGLVGRKDECESCHADLHVCKNCAHYDENSYNECKDSAAERVVEKEKSNFCDLFTPNTGNVGAGQSRDDLLSAADALFKK